MGKTFHKRTGLLIIGLCSIFFGLYSLYQDFSPFFKSGHEGELELIFSLVDTLIAFCFIILGLSLYYIGKYWRKSFIHLTSLCVSISLIFLTSAIVLYPIHSNAHEIVDSTQPSIDYLVINSLDVRFDNLTEIYYGENLTLELYENVESEKYNVNSLTVNQLDNMAQVLGYSDKMYEDKFIITQYVVSTIYNQLAVLSPRILEAPMTLNLIINRIDPPLVRNLEPSLIKSTYTVNQRAYFTVILPSVSQIRVVTIGNVSDEDVNSIWLNTGLDKSNSLEHKRRVVDIALSMILRELNNPNVETSSFPVPTVFAIIPENIRFFFSYDFLNPSISKRVLEVGRIRSDCENGILISEKVCSGIRATEYEKFIASIGNLAQRGDIGLSFNVSKTLEPINTIEKFEREVKEVSSLWRVSLIIAVFFFFLAFFLYSYHFRLSKKEMIGWHVPYYVSKLNLISFVSVFILILVAKLILSSGRFVELISYMLAGDSNQILPKEVFFSLPAYQVTIDIMSQIVTLSLCYLIFSVILFGFFYFMLKKSVDIS